MGTRLLLTHWEQLTVHWWEKRFPEVASWGKSALSHYGLTITLHRRTKSDANAGSLDNMFDFSRPGDEGIFDRLFLDPSTGEPVPPGQS